MAVANTKSTSVTNADAEPVRSTPALINCGNVRESVAKVDVAVADDNGSVYRLFRVWSDWRISSVEIWNTTIAGGIAFDLGIYKAKAFGGLDGGADVEAVNDDLFASTLDMSSARSVPLDVTCEAVAGDIANIEQPLWQRLGLESDPKCWYDIALTADTVGTGAGTIAGRVRYVDGV